MKSKEQHKKEVIKLNKNNKNEYFRRVYTEANQPENQSDIQRAVKKYQMTFNNNQENNSLKKSVTKLAISQSIDKKCTQCSTVKPKKHNQPSKHKQSTKKNNIKKMSKSKALLTEMSDNSDIKDLLKKQKSNITSTFSAFTFPKKPKSNIKNIFKQEGSKEKKKKIQFKSKDQRGKVQNPNQKKKPKQKDFSKCHFEITQVIDSGTFGIVYKARVSQTKQIVAIKKVLQDKKYKNRELQILQLLNHPNVLKLKHAFFTVEQSQQYLNVVMQYYQGTIFDLNKSYLKNKQLMPNIFIKLFSYQFFRALAYIHAIGICHRDIKPHNILVDNKSNKVVLCDFGSAKKLIKNQPNIAYICSRCYRAPELIFGATNYNSLIDMWSIGCVIIQLINGQPLFLGQSNVDQLTQIIKVLGSPSKEQVLKMNNEYDISDYNFPPIKMKEWRKVLRPKLDPLLIDLISKVMLYSPEDRLKPVQALLHPYFDSFRDQSKFLQIKSKINVPQLFNFSKQQLSYSKSKFLTPLWYKQ